MDFNSKTSKRPIMQANFIENFSSSKNKKKKNGKSKTSSQLVSKSQVRNMISSVVQNRNLSEWKYYVNSITSQNISFSGLLMPLTDVPQGTIDQARTGDAVSLVSLEVNYGFYAATQANACRIIIFQWSPAVLGGPGLSQITALTGSAIVPFSPYAVDPYQQVDILYDQVHSLSPTEPLRLGNFKTKDFKFRSVQFTNGTLTGTSKIFAYFISDDGVTPYPTISCASKLYFTDN